MCTGFFFDGLGLFSRGCFTGLGGGSGLKLSLLFRGFGLSLTCIGDVIGFSGLTGFLTGLTGGGLGVGEVEGESERERDGEEDDFRLRDGLWDGDKEGDRESESELDTGLSLRLRRFST